ncbi:Glycosylphosphatidylinositol (GPI) anchor assembly protein [Ascosphaera atra]|nr:Glycosylphosphatidylinositol (GPI) anchor assembly protein [Ascosphaera atra]
MAPQSHAHSPISLLPSPTARAYSVLHPFLLLSLFAARFDRLVQNTTDTIIDSLLPLIALQCLYVVVCLPPAGTVVTSEGELASAGDGVGGGGGDAPTAKMLKKRREQAAAPASRTRITTALLSLSLPLLLGTPILLVVLILFGAPLTTHLYETSFLAAHMCVLAGTSLVYVHGTNTRVWSDIAGINRPVDAVWGGVLGTALGAWFGTIPIPLDWDRPWQAYPITIMAGSYIGYAVGCLLGRCPPLYGKKIRFTENEGNDEK